MGGSRREGSERRWPAAPVADRRLSRAAARLPGQALGSRAVPSRGRGGIAGGRDEPPAPPLCIECFSNPRRRHSGHGYLSPVEFEQQHQLEAIPA